MDLVDVVGLGVLLSLGIHILPISIYMYTNLVDYINKCNIHM